MDEILTTYAPSDRDIARLENDYQYHAPFGDQVARYAGIRSQCKDLALHLMTVCPPSRELSVALTHLEQVSMMANAAIARNEKEGPAS